MRLSLQVGILLVVLMIPACSRQAEQASPPKASKAKPSAKYQTIEDVPEDFRKNAEAFALKLESAMREGNHTELRSAFDMKAIVDGVCDGITAPGASLTSFKTSMQMGMQNSTVKLADLWSQASPKYKGLVIYKGSLATRFRFVSEDGGISVIDMVVRTNQRSRLAIANFCNHAMGYDLVEQSRQIAAPILSQIDKNFLERIIDKPDITPEQLGKFGAFAEKVQSGDADGAIRAYKSLPESLRHSMVATCLYITILQRTEDNEAYKQALKDAAARFKSASFQFMLVDAYALEQNFAKAAECVDAFIKVIGKDAVLLTLKGLMVNSGGNVPAARDLLNEALLLEPDCVYVHSKGLDILLAAKDFKAVSDSIQFLEKNAGYDFKGNLTDPVWDEFKKDPESKPWR